jgi:hypothetical protein
MSQPGRLTLGRHAEELGPEALRHHLVSRSHARLLLDPDGALTLEDLASRNGTFLNGLRTDQARLAPGDVVGLGPFLLFVHRAPATHLPPLEPRAPAPLDGVSLPLQSLLDRARSLAPGSLPLIIEGDPGTGKERLARALHDLSRPGGPWVVLDPGILRGDLLVSELFGHVPGAFPGAAEGRDGLLAAAHGGTLLLDGLELASPALQAALLRFLDDGEVRPLGAVAPRRVDARLIALSRWPIPELIEAGKLTPAFAHRLAWERLRVPPLRERREDVALVFRGILEEQGIEGVPAPQLTLALLSSELPGNARQLRSVARRATRGESGELRLDAALAGELGVSSLLALVSRGGEEQPLVARDGSWFVLPDQRRCELLRRPSLQRILACLVQASGHPVDTGALLEAGWPGERIQATAGQSRVYVAIATLRRLGLRDAIGHDERGYHLLPGVSIDGEEPSLSPRG